MREMLREFKDAPFVWGGVLFLLAAVQTIISTIMIMLANADAAQKFNGLREHAKVFHQALVLLPFPTMLVVSVFVILSVTSSAVNQRRHELALLGLQGATPMQLTLRIAMQVLLLNIAAGLISLVASPLLAHDLYPLATTQMEATGLVFVSVPLSVTIQAWGLGTILGALVSILGALLSIHTISRISPVEALRQATNPPRRIGKLRASLAILFIFLALTSFIIGYFSTTPTSMGQITSKVTFSAMTPMFLSCSLGMVCLVTAIALAGPTILAWTVRAWTTLLPFPSASWKIACGQAEFRVRRSSPTILPLVVGLTALMTFQGMSLVIDAWSRLLPGNLGDLVEVPGITRTLTLLAPALLIVVAGMVSGYLIMARGRELDLALISISGADNRQLGAISTLDGVISATTAVVLAFVSTSVAMFAFVMAEGRTFAVETFVIPWRTWGLILLILCLFTAVLSWLVVLRSFHESAVKTIAQRVGE